MEPQSIATNQIGLQSHWPFTHVNRWPITTFYVLTLIVSWPLGMLGTPGPSIAAMAAAALIDGRSAVKALLRRVAIWRVGVRWYVIALFGPVALFGLAVAVNMWMGAEIVPGAQLFDAPEFGILFLSQVVGVFTGPWEELGWRGFALPRLLDKWSPLTASLVLGVLWAMWHIPVFLSGHIPWADAAFVVAASVLFTAVFVRTKQSVLIAFLMHAALNAAGGVAVSLFNEVDRTQLYWSLTVVTAVAGLVVVAMDAGWWLGRPSQPRDEDHPHDQVPEKVRSKGGLAV